MDEKCPDNADEAVEEEEAETGNHPTGELAPVTPASPDVEECDYVV